MARLVALCSPLALAGLALFAPQEERIEDLPLVREGEHFRVLCHFNSERAADEALRTVEALFPAAEELYGTHDAELREVNLYGTAEEYEAAEYELTQGKFARNLAFAHFGTVSAHVALQPQLSDAALERVGLPQITRELLAHEAAHLLRYDAFPNHRAHPRWFADGAADWLDGRALAAMGVDTSPSTDPEAAQTYGTLASNDEDGQLPRVEQVLSTDLEELGFYRGYAARELWFRFLMEEEPKSMAKVIDQIRRRGGSERDEFTEAVYDDARKAFGSRFKKLDRSFEKWLGKVEPAWEQVYRSLELRTDGDSRSWLCAAFGSSNALVWRTEQSGRRGYTIRGEVEILPGAEQQLNLLLGRGDRGFVQISLVAGYGVTVFDFVAAGNQWNRLAGVESADLTLGERVPFEVSVKGSGLALDLGGERLVEIADTGHDLSGPWGLGALAGSAGLWHDLEAPGLD